jgi:hypothetical protein
VARNAWRGLILALAVAPVALGGCGGDERAGTELVPAGYAKVDLEGTTRGGVTGDTVPVAGDETSAAQRLGSAYLDFRSCLEGEGFADVDLGNVLADFQSLEPALQQALASCNNETGIAQVYQEFQAEQEAMTPEQAEERNKVMVGLFDCLDRRGWEVGDFGTDQNGLLQIQAVPEPPPNADEEKDFSECGRQAAEEAGVDI